MTPLDQVKVVFLAVMYRNTRKPARLRIQAAAEVLRLIYGGGQ